MIEQRRAAAAVAVARIRAEKAIPTAEQLWVSVADLLGRAIHFVAACERDLLAVAQQIGFLHFEPAGVFAAAAAEVNAGLERPHIARAYFDVHDAVANRYRHHLRVEQIAIAAKNALAFIEQPLLERLAAREQ
jgi:hypothetical protein